VWYVSVVSGRKSDKSGDEAQELPGWTSDQDLSGLLLRACHDLRASLRTIRAQAELIRRDGHALTDFEQRIGFIIDGVRKIDSLANSLLSYSVALQIQKTSFVPIGSDVVLRTALAKLEKELSDRRAEVVSGELPRVNADPDRLAQVFETLLSNALGHIHAFARADPRGAKALLIQITAEKSDDHWIFAVSDNGPGIDASRLNRIFQPFERLHRNGQDEVGLGLAICKTIVERHGGNMWAESNPEAGSTFFFTLPALSP
jgi:chemotaxis family two-component system sensor kinase Cph1